MLGNSILPIGPNYVYHFIRPPDGFRICATYCTLPGLFAVVGSSGEKGGEKVEATIILIDKDSKEYTYNIKFTDGASLRDALYEAELIDEDEYSAMFVSNIDGHIANAIEDGVTWMPQDTNRKQIMGTFDDITIHAGDTIYLQYYIVPDFD